MGVVVDPFARCRNPLAWRDSGGVADDRDQIAMATGLCPQNAEAVLAIVEGDTLDKARQYFLGRWFLLWPHLCCRCWRQSPQPDLETCAALALLVSDAVPASTFDGRPHLPHVAALGARSGRGADPHVARSGSEIGAIKAVAETRFDRTAWGAASSNHTISTIQSSQTARFRYDSE